MDLPELQKLLNKAIVIKDFVRLTKARKRQYTYRHIIHTNKKDELY